MCQYCGCQDVAVIGELTQEHDAVVALIADVRRSLADDRLDDVARTCRRMIEVLGPHTVVEEDGLFPELVDDFPDHVTQLSSEHRQVDAVLREAVDGTPTDPDWPQRLQEAMFVLREHILKEQDGVFPAALSALDGAQWERVEAVRARAGGALAARGAQ